MGLARGFHVAFNAHSSIYTNLLHCFALFWHVVYYQNIRFSDVNSILLLSKTIDQCPLQKSTLQLSAHLNQGKRKRKAGRKIDVDESRTGLDRCYLFEQYLQERYFINKLQKWKEW